MTTSVNPQEIAHFAKDSARWWDESGPFAPLHRLTPARMGYIRDRIACAHACPRESLTPFTSLEILDIGCGGGLTCEPLARLGAAVTGIDADAQAVAAAQAHAAQAGLEITYRAAAAETLLENRGNAQRFHAVLALEIVEHVDAVEDFVQSCVDLCRPGGIVIFSTLNRTARSFALGIVAAEYILRWVPRGTHDWRRFLRPSELARAVRRAGAAPEDISGLLYSPAPGDFTLSPTDFSVNYLLSARKP